MYRGKSELPEKFWFRFIIKDNQQKTPDCGQRNTIK